jgi:hypothetical protein
MGVPDLLRLPLHSIAFGSSLLPNDSGADCLIPRWSSQAQCSV